MTSAIREISIQRGHDPRDFTLIAFGGAGPMHALAMADEIGIPRVLVPRHPGNFSALGLLAADIKHDDVRTRVGPLRERLPALRLAFAEMEAAARAAARAGRLRARAAAAPALARPPLPRPGVRAQPRRRARHRGSQLDRIEADFHRQHRDTYGHANPQAAIELVNARLTAYGLVPKPAAERHAAPGVALDGGARRAPAGLVRGRARTTARCGSGSACPSAPSCAGPAIVEEFGATTVVPPGWRGAMDAHGNLRFEREARA